MLSSRGKQNADSFDIPWRYAAAPTYNKDTNPTGVISLGLAEHGPARDDIVDYINNKVKFDVNSICYGSMATENPLPAAAASHLNRLLKPIKPIEPEMVVKSNGCSAAGNMLAFAIAEPGDAVLVSRPVYGRFELDYGVQGGVQVVYADTDPDEVFSPVCVEKYENALQYAEAKGTKIKAVVLVNPHNPIGRCYPTETLIEILRFCNKHQLHLISDEIYASCVFDSGNPNAPTFTSILSIATPELIDLNLVHVLYGFAKDFASGGLHLGFIISQNSELRRACNAMVRFHSPSSVSETIGTAILRDEKFVSRYFEKSQQGLAYSYRIATSILDQEGINYVKGGNAGFFVYIDLSPYLLNEAVSTGEREFAVAQRLLDNGVFLHPGEEHCKDPGWFRLVFTHDEDVLREGLRRIVTAVNFSI